MSDNKMNNKQKKSSGKNGEKDEPVEGSSLSIKLVDLTAKENTSSVQGGANPAHLPPPSASSMQPDHIDQLALAIAEMSRNMSFGMQQMHDNQVNLVEAIKVAGEKRKSVSGKGKSSGNPTPPKKPCRNATNNHTDLNANHSDLDYEESSSDSEGELSSSDELVEKIDLILQNSPAKPSAQVQPDLTTVQSTQPTSQANNNDDADDGLAQIAQLLVNDEQNGPNINTQLAEIFNNMLSKKLADDRLKSKLDEFAPPGNVPLLQPPKVNNLIWNKLSNSSRSIDIRLKKVQIRNTRGMVAVAKLAEKLLDAKKGRATLDLTECLGFALSAFCLLSNGNIELSLRRREQLRRDMNPRYASLCSSENPITAELFGDDVQRSIKDINESQKVGSSVGASGSYHNQYMNRHGHGNGGRHFKQRGHNRKFGGFNGKGKGNQKPYNSKNWKGKFNKQNNK